MTMIKAGIIGGAGYTAGELVRLLLNHPDVQLCWVSSSSRVGERIDVVHQGLIGETDLEFIGGAPLDEVDVLFLCMAHGRARDFMEAHRDQIPENLRIIDLSRDFRLKSEDHEFVYGLPELNRKRIVREAKYVANPGCFAAAIELALLPLAKNLMLGSDIHVTAITGSTGSGVKLGATRHYSWRNDNVSMYKPFRHQHVPEIKQSLRQLQSSFDKPVRFLPVRGAFSRGIFATIYLKCNSSIDVIRKLYEEYYDDHNFTFITDKVIDLKDVVGTNKCLLHLERIDDMLLITSAIDNLLKGASGNAVHNMNLLFGLHERIGLNLKAIAF